MKKKILLVSLMIVAIICIFTVSAFAVEIVSKTESEEYGTVIQLNSDPGLDNASQYVSTLKKINNASTDTEALSVLTDGTYFYVFPTSYINVERADGILDLYTGTEENPGLAQAMAEFNEAMGTNYYEGYAVVGSGTERRIEETVRFTFPSDVTEMRDSICCIRYYPKLVELRFTQAIDLTYGGDTFKGCSKLETVVGFEKMDPTLLTRTIFTGCTSLQSIKLPTSITRIPNSMFAGCGKVRIENLDECTQLTTIGSGAFQDTKTLVFTLPDSVTTIEKSAFQSAFKEAGASFTINKTSNLVTIGESAFHDSKTLSYMYIPSTVTSIGKNAFRNNNALEVVENIENCQITTLEDGTFAYASKIKTLKLPKTLTAISTAFADNSALTLVYIPDSVTSIANTFTGGKPTNAVYIYTGTSTSVFSGCDKLSGATVINASDYNPNNSYTGINLVVGYSNCLAYNNGNHEESVVKSVDVTSYYEVITVHNVCKECGMDADDTQIPALFSCLGYSAPQDGRVGIVLGFTVDNEAVELYEGVTGKSVSYGVFAIAESKVEKNDIFDENGDVLAGAITTDLTSYGFASFDLKILGFADNQKDLELAMGAYLALTSSEGTEYVYLQSGEVATDDKYAFTTYNLALNKSKEEEVV